MTETPPFADLLSLIDDRAAAFRDALSAATDPAAARVPGCPEWSLSDLARHLGEVHRFWAATVASPEAGGPPPEPSIDADPHDLVQWSDESTGQLLAALRDVDPAKPCWAWWPESAAPHTAAAIARHQVQEAAVHAYDAQETIGKREPLPGVVAVDGVAEFLAACLGAQGAWPHRPARIAFTATDGPSWVVDLSSTGAVPDPAASGDPVCTVHASASDLVLALYGRVQFDDFRVEGDRSVLAELRGWSKID